MTPPQNPLAQSAEHYAHVNDKPFFPQLVQEGAVAFQRRKPSGQIRFILSGDLPTNAELLQRGMLTMARAREVRRQLHQRIWRDGDDGIHVDDIGDPSETY